MTEVNLGTCEHCQKHFEYSLVHCGFSDCIYAYCDSDGTTAILSLWDNRIPKSARLPFTTGDMLRNGELHVELRVRWSIQERFYTSVSPL
jgi:hypothetical protein